MPAREPRRRRLDAEVAASVDAPAVLLPHLPDLFADLVSLGSTPRQISNWLAAAGIRSGSTVIDLGCGKGGAAIHLASRLECRVTGIDAFAPFIASAREHAERCGVQDRCDFRAGDYRSMRRSRLRFDVGLMLGVAPVEVAIPLLHRLVRPDGLFIVDDAAWIDRKRAAPEGIPTLDDVRTLVERLGDRLVRTHIATPGEVRRMEGRLHARISTRARLLARRNPPLRRPLRTFLSAQRTAAKSLTGSLRPVLWMIRRA